MRTCANCKKRLWFWNSYHRRHPPAELINNEIQNIYFCNSKCTFEYIEKCGIKIFS